MLIEECVLECFVDDGNKKEIEEKGCTVDPWRLCGTREQKRSKYQSKPFKK